MDTRGRLRNDSANENKEIEVVIKPFEFYFLKKFYDFAFICVVYHSDLVWIMHNVHVVLITLQVLKKESQMARGCSCVWKCLCISTFKKIASPNRDPMIDGLCGNGIDGTFFVAARTKTFKNTARFTQWKSGKVIINFSIRFLSFRCIFVCIL